MAMLEVRDLEVYYGVIQALKGISFDVNQGEIVALIGANGAGKTTTLHTVTGLLSARSGHIMYEGTDFYKASIYWHCKFDGFSDLIPIRRRYFRQDIRLSCCQRSIHKMRSFS